MSENALLEMLRCVQFLDGIADEHLERLAEMSRIVEFAEGNLIFREGDPADDIFLIVKGNVSLEICAPGIGCRRIFTAGEGDLLGLSPLLDNVMLTATARTMAPTQAIVINSGQILTMCEHEPRFGYVFMRRAASALAKRLNATRVQLLDVFGDQMPAVSE